MLELTVPGWRSFRLAHLVLDVNGTLAKDGEPLPGVAERLEALRQRLTLHVLTANTYGRQAEIDASLGLTAVRLRPDEPEVEQKARYVRVLGGDSVVAIGNGANDAGMLREAAIGIAVLGPEGLAVETLLVADVVAAPLDALDLLLHPRRLVATLRR